MNPDIPLHKWRPGEYQSSATHADDSTAFRARQLERLRRMQLPTPAQNVREMKRRAK